MRKKAIQNLANQIAEIDRQRRAPSGVDEDRLTPTEATFFEMLDQRGKVGYRGGWPDFLVEDPDAGSFIGVEVKSPNDDIRPSQARMFAVLERAGISVMIWRSDRPTVLTPWRMYKCKNTAIHAAPLPRQRIQGRVTTLDWSDLKRGREGDR